MRLALLRRCWTFLKEVIYPSQTKCMGCGDETGCEYPFLCSECKEMMKPSNVIAGREEWRKRGIESISFAYYYGRPIRGLIRAFKFQGIKILGEYLADDMIRLLESRCHKPYDLIIPVPLHPARLYERGFNQAEVLAQLISQHTSIPLNTNILRRTRRTKQQAKLSRSKRAKNLKNAISAQGDLTGKRILIVDDVITTGSTICSCAEALKACGAAEIRAISIAGTHYCHYGSSHRYRLKKEK